MYYSIQACRAVAAILVVCFHAGRNLAKPSYFGIVAEPINRLFDFGGLAGVAFFFVLSGFIITHIHWNDWDSPKRLPNYIRKRVTRIYPPYLIVFVCVYTLALMTPSLRDTMPSDPVILLKSLLLLPQDPATVGGTGAPVLVVAWSLQYEMVFYVIVALAIVSRWLFAAIVVLLAVNFAAQAAGGHEPFPFSFFANPRILLFGMGMAVAVGLRKGNSFKRPLLVAGGAGIAFLWLGLVSEYGALRLSETILNLGYGAISSVFILAIIQAEQRRPNAFRNPRASLLGDSSYALYLLHFPLISILSKLVTRAGFSGLAAAIGSFVGISIACVLVALVFHVYVESPLLQLLARSSASPAKTPRVA
jgi:exopolysaccharide production protein ExoZ